MDHLWIPVTLAAALAQTGRNATQRGLTERLGTLGATNVRFLFGLPFACAFLVLALWLTNATIPTLTPRALIFTALGAAAQIAATALMLQAMRNQGFGLVTAWLKVEPVLVALIGWAVLGEALTLPMLAAIAVAVGGVLVMTLKPGQGRSMLSGLAPSALGLAAGLAFGLSAIGFRGAITALPEGSFLIRALTILALTLALQTLALGLWLAVRDRPALTGSLRAFAPSLAAGFLGALASAGWFTGFALTTAANVRTLALVEVIFALLVARLAFGQRASPRQLAGIGILLLGVVLLLRA
ncbi:MAG: DMT family transporter [Tabrizicola sp.]|uniref:EamA family transporter n=1 Tax=Tabrizicola sp. TaxID=2005166 RepID=UPI001B4727DD|nr:DMT family transporter [Tabrizicola sp.]MCC6517970.1 DMT family transporter [Tabrizicola sp.]